jgi:1-acyl-sn-glycerol-3-phosphate acyltransferase
MYLFVKNLTLFTVWLFCKRFSLYNREAREIKTPLIIGCNHPNSFLDAILVGAQMKQRVHFITRSDVFKKAWVRAILRSVNMIPIYRIRDGKDNLGKNDQTFEECRQILLRGEHVLIFVEGFCKYQTSLQLPLKKGAPRMFIQALEDGLNIQCLPVWLRYSSFFSFPKEVDIHFGTVFGKEVLNGIDETGARMNAINKETGDQLQILSEIHQQPVPTINKAFLLLPALLAIATHFLFYLPVQQLAYKLKGEIHYDSILFCMIAFLYPVYLLSIAIVTGAFFGLWWALLIVVLLPLLARAYVLWK